MVADIHVQIQEAYELLLEVLAAQQAYAPGVLPPLADFKRQVRVWSGWLSKDFVRYFYGSDSGVMAFFSATSKRR